MHVGRKREVDHGREWHGSPAQFLTCWVACLALAEEGVDKQNPNQLFSRAASGNIAVSRLSEHSRNQGEETSPHLLCKMY